MDSFEISCDFPVSSTEAYAAWLNSELHSAFTGGLATIQEEIESRFTAWDGYITGRILELEKDQRIIQSWRTTEFGDDDDDSMVEIGFADNSKGCTMTLKHWNIPNGQGDKYKSGWDTHYIVPMKEFFLTY